MRKRAVLSGVVAGLVGFGGFAAPVGAAVAEDGSVVPDTFWDPAPSSTVVDIGEPAEVAVCVEGSSKWRIFGHLVVAFESCELGEDLSADDTLWLLMDEGGSPVHRCFGLGGVLRFIGDLQHPERFHLLLCTGRGGRSGLSLDF